MTLNPEVEALLDTLAQSDAPELHTLPVPDARAMAAAFAAMGVPTEKVASVEDRVARGCGLEVPVRVYRPTVDEVSRPVLVYLHGSGWMYGDLEMSDAICRRIANAADCIVVAPDYRLAPEHPYPAALNDTVAVLEWVVTDIADFGGDADRLAIGGESAGGNLAAASALALRDRGGPALRMQLLVCPVIDHDFDTESYLAYADGFILTRSAMRWLWDLYVPEASRRDEPYASPLRADDLRGVAPALVMTAELDPLRDEGEAYAARLRDAGISVESCRYDGLVHGFMTLGGVLSSGASAIDDAARALQRALATEEPSS